MEPLLHNHECPACERKFGCNRGHCYQLFYRLCGACRDARTELRRDPVQTLNRKES